MFDDMRVKASYSDMYYIEKHKKPCPMMNAGQRHSCLNMCRTKAEKKTEFRPLPFRCGPHSFPRRLYVRQYSEPPNSPW